MSEEIENIYRKTWARIIQPVSKIGYMDGASNGQTAAFQPSFDVGFELGLDFGLELGFKETTLSMQRHTNQPISQGVNCQVCMHGVSSQENIGNLYNIQKERNVEYLLNYNKIGCN